jgi:glycosyltransferase involved in cell wall biosynthesis
MGAFGERLLPLLVLFAMPFAALCDELPSAAPKVSVCIPVYNVEPWLPAALDSAINQTLKDIEIICIDDGSTDGSLAILNSYAAKDPRIHVLQNGVNRGLLYTRVRSILESIGDYIMCLDSDDELFLDIAEKAYGKAIATGADVVVFGVRALDNSGHEMKISGLNFDLSETSRTRTIDEFYSRIVDSRCPRWAMCYGRLWDGCRLRKLAEEVFQFVDSAGQIFMWEDEFLTWNAIRHMRNFAMLDTVGHAYYAMRGGAHACQGKVRLHDFCKLLGKLVADAKTPAEFGRAMDFERRHRSRGAVEIICSLPTEEAIAEIEKYLEPLPPPFDLEVEREIGKKNRRLIVAYQKYKRAKAKSTENR